MFRLFFSKVYISTFRISRDPFYDKIVFGPSNENIKKEREEEDWLAHFLLLNYLEDRLGPARSKHKEILNAMRILVHSSFAEEFPLTLVTIVSPFLPANGFQSHSFLLFFAIRNVFQSKPCRFKLLSLSLRLLHDCKTNDPFQECLIRKKIYGVAISWFSNPEYLRLEDSKTLSLHIDALRLFYTTIEADKIDFQNLHFVKDVSVAHASSHDSPKGPSLPRVAEIIIQDFYRFHVLLSAFLLQEIERLMVWMDPLGSSWKEPNPTANFKQRSMVGFQVAHKYYCLSFSP
jgi:hypothetical protein